MNKKLFNLFRLVMLLLTSSFFIPAKALAQEARIITGVVADASNRETLLYHNETIISLIISFYEL